MSKKVTIMAEQNGKELASRIQNNIQKVLVGKEEVTELLLTALIADGHVLLEDVPGHRQNEAGQGTGKIFKCPVFPGAVYPGSVAR